MIETEVGYPYYMQVLLLGKVVQFLSFVEKGTGIEQSENYYRRPRIIILIAYGGIQNGGHGACRASLRLPKQKKA